MTQSVEKSSKFIAGLPIDNDDKLYLDANKARAFGEELSESYCFAEPFPYIVIDDFLPLSLIDEIFDSFPIEKLDGDVVHNIGYGGLHKRQVAPESCK